MKLFNWNDFPSPVPIHWGWIRRYNLRVRGPGLADSELGEFLDPWWIF